MPTITKDQEWAVLPYNSEKIGAHYLVSNFLGNWDILTPEEFKLLDQFCSQENDELFSRLNDKGIILNKESVDEAISTFRRLNANLFSDTSLHIAVLTTRCNIACTYCQTRVDNPEDMDLKVAGKVLEYMLNVSNPNIHLEFQGGEALLNWEVLKTMVENVQKYKATYKVKNVAMSIVSNGVLLKDDKMEFLIDNGVNICMSLDGPEKVHNTNRTFSSGQGSYEYVADAIKRLKVLYKKRDLNRPINLISTVNKDNLQDIKKMIDEYVSWGATDIALRPINKLGGAYKDWKDLGLTPEEFNPYWAEAIDYILELNKKGIDIKERMATVMLTKMLAKRDPGYVDLMNPCGAGRAVLTYMPNGDVYPCDEARMFGDDFFKLGNIFEDTYEEIMKSSKMFSICQSSVMDLYDYNSAFLPWMGTDPFLNYRHQGSLIPKITQSPAYKINRFQFEYLIKKMIEDKQNLEIFQKWVI